VIAASVLSLAVVAGTVALIAVPLVKQGSALWKALPETTEKLTQRLDKMRDDYPILSGVLPGTAKDGSEAPRPPTPGETKETVKGVAYAASRVLEGFVTFVSLFFIGIFLAADPRRYTEGLARLLPGAPFDERVELLHDMGAALRNYLVALGIYIVAMAALWALGLWLIGIDYFLLFGVIGGVVEVVPYVGPLVGLVPPLFVALGMGTKEVLLVLGLYAILHVVEGYILVPMLMEKREKLPPVVTLVAILGFGAAFGFWGVVLAVPLATVLHVWVVRSLLAEETKPAAPAPVIVSRRAA
jgi:predicted PurR-regulated permease PerM